ncbi:MAG: T9SS type A sorting domain-containing protein [Flammeovirgaceae bacterium]|nr:T9SS type A sorting domain-containing protein [Flammeovirgaceae bacterium]
MEATRNGLDWIALADGYDAGFSSDWISAFNNGLITVSMFKHHEINLTDKFAVGDTLLIRFKLFSNTFITGWGWAINYMAIQEEPLAAEVPYGGSYNFNVYPNPAKQRVSIDYQVASSSNVYVTVFDPLGRVLLNDHLGQKAAGDYSYGLHLNEGLSGFYIIQLQVGSESRKKKLLVLR